MISFTAIPSFLEGIARVLDLGGTMAEFNKSLTEEETDEQVFAADWKAVGQDMTDAIRLISIEFFAETGGE